MDEKEKDIFLQIHTNKGRVYEKFFDYDQNLMRELLQKYNLYDTYKNAEMHRYNALASGDLYDDKAKALIKDKEIIDKVKLILSENGIKIPDLLSDEEKKSQMYKELESLGINKETADKLGLENIEIAETEGCPIQFSLEDNETTQSILKNENIDFTEDNGKLNIKGKILAKEGFLVQDTEKNRKILDDNELTYIENANDGRSLFVPLQIKKIGFFLLLVASGSVGGIIPTLVLQVLLNKTGLLNKLLDQNIIGRNQMKALNKGYTIMATMRDHGKNVEQYLFRDKTTGELCRINTRDVAIPNQINGVILSPVQRERYQKGEVIDLELKNGTDISVRIDMNEQTGYRTYYKELKNDKELIEVPKRGSSDEEKLRYISIRGVEAINHLYGNKRMNPERDAFLDRYNMRKPYTDLLNNKDKYNKEYNQEKKESILSETASLSNSIRDLASSAFIDMKQSQSNSYKM